MTTPYELPGNLSYSQISNWKTCGERYRLERLMKAPSKPGWALLGGSAVHKATEDFDHALFEGNVFSDDELTAHFQTRFDEEIDEQHAKGFTKDDLRPSGRASKAWPNKEDESWWRSNGPTFVKHWTVWRLNSSWEIHVNEAGMPAIETGFTIELGGVPVKGAIDRIMTDGTNIMPVDLKSGREPDDTLQLGIYALAMRELMGLDPQFGCYWMARTGSTSTPADMTRFTRERLDYEFRGVRAAMEAGIFPAKVSNMCVSCGVKDSCYAVGGADAAQFQPFPSDPAVSIGGDAA